MWPKDLLYTKDMYLELSQFTCTQTKSREASREFIYLIYVCLNIQESLLQLHTTYRRERLLDQCHVRAYLVQNHKIRFLWAVSASSYP